MSDLLDNEVRGESLDAPENRPKEASGQMASGKLEHDVTRTACGRRPGPGAHRQMARAEGQADTEALCKTMPTLANVT